MSRIRSVACASGNSRKISGTPAKGLAQERSGRYAMTT
jgi:hypothetical protein